MDQSPTHCENTLYICILLESSNLTTFSDIIFLCYGIGISRFKFCGIDFLIELQNFTTCTFSLAFC